MTHAAARRLHVISIDRVPGRHSFDCIEILLLVTWFLEDEDPISPISARKILTSLIGKIPGCKIRERNCNTDVNNEMRIMRREYASKIP